MPMTHDQLLTDLAGRGYGPRYARMLAHRATVDGRIVDEPRDRPAIQIYATNDARTRFVVREVTVTRAADDDVVAACESVARQLRDLAACESESGHSYRQSALDLGLTD